MVNRLNSFKNTQISLEEKLKVLLVDLGFRGVESDLGWVYKTHSHANATRLLGNLNQLVFMVQEITILKMK